MSVGREWKGREAKWGGKRERERGDLGGATGLSEYSGGGFCPELDMAKVTV